MISYYHSTHASLARSYKYTNMIPESKQKLAVEFFGQSKQREKQAGDMEGAVQAYEEALGIHEPPGATSTRDFFARFRFFWKVL